MEANHHQEISNSMRRTCLVVSCILLAIGCCGGPLVLRLYFVHGGKRIWLTAMLESAGWPISIIPLLLSYIHRRKSKVPSTNLISIKLPTFVSAAIISFISAISNYTYTFGVAHLPVSTSSLIAASQLTFTAFFAFVIVKQKFTPYSTNAVVLLTVGTVVLALHAGSDRPEGESNRLYILGFLLTFVSSALSGLMMPLLELTYKKAKQAITPSLVMEIQIVVSFFATAFCIVGMIVDNDFKVIPREAKEYQLGEAKYYVVLVFSAIMWQFFLLGIMGIVFSSSALVSGITASALLPITEVLAVIVFHDKFQAEKGVALVLSLWGFCSHFYGEIKHSKKESQVQETEICPTTNAVP
ncbi:hypothetical protein ACH5RR_034668 [Cinchona calisaya]|uniref:Probable purine permease n=1 Tax=Cinchona calisaya TaxID=153742 RepID=A0ABD2YG25_9GENT